MEEKYSVVPIKSVTVKLIRYYSKATTWGNWELFIQSISHDVTGSSCSTTLDNVYQVLISTLAEDGSPALSQGVASRLQVRDTDLTHRVLYSQFTFDTRLFYEFR